MQKRIPHPTTQDSPSFKKSAEVAVEEQATRTVRLSYKSCCGCGCDYEDILREVPTDSDLSDGDVVERMESGDWYPED